MDWGAGTPRPLAYRLDENGEPEPMDMNDPDRWVRYGDPFRDPRRRVAKNVVDDYEVSTVFLVVDHQYTDGPPVLWETMVFGPEPWGDYQHRYISREDAAKGHARVVAALLAGKCPWEMPKPDCD